MSERIEPVRKVLAVTPSDSADLPGGQARGFHVNVAGDVEFDDTTGNTVVLTCAAGVPYPYVCKRIRDGNTTATGIFALY